MAISREAAREAFLALALVFSGAAALVLEIAGTRAISPFFGTTIHVWAALISVTLGSLAAGYAWGGARADKAASFHDFYRLLCLAGLLVVFPVPLRGLVVRAASFLGLCLGSLVAAAVLFAPSLALLGALGPIGIRLLARAASSIGAKVGWVYFLTTIGGVLGALGTGFYLLPALGLRAIFLSVGFSLLGFGAAGLWLSRGEAQEPAGAVMDASGPAAQSPEQRFLLLAVLLCGTCTLTVEMCASTLIGSFYGATVYGWAAVLAVTLVALSLGYQAGGRLADSRPSFELFLGLLTALAMLVPLAVHLRVPALQASARLGVRAGSLAAAAALFGPMLALCGALGPLAVRLRAGGLGTLGRSVGSLYALSSAGNVLGALLAGYAVIPRLGVLAALSLLSAIWLLLAASGLLLKGRARLALGLLAGVGALVLGAWPRRRLAPGVLWQREGFYGQVEVKEISGRRVLAINGGTQSIVDTADGESDLEYCHGLELAGRWARPGSRALVIGLGAGSIPGMLAKAYGHPVDAVEIDPTIVEAAREEFGYAPGGGLFIEDGRRFAAQVRGSYGLIVLDAYGGDSPPAHLFTAESFATLHGALEPDGILALNFIAHRGEDLDPDWLAVYKTLLQAFPNVRVFAAQDESVADPNILFFASARALDRIPDASEVRYASQLDVRAMLSRELSPSQRKLKTAPIMTDDYAPLEYLQAKTALARRQGMLELRLALLR